MGVDYVRFWVCRGIFQSGRLELAKVECCVYLSHSAFARYKNSVFKNYTISFKQVIDIPAAVAHSYRLFLYHSVEATRCR